MDVAVYAVDQTVDAAERVVGVAAAPFTFIAWGVAAASRVLSIFRREFGVFGGERKSTGNIFPLDFL